MWVRYRRGRTTSLRCGQNLATFVIIPRKRRVVALSWGWGMLRMTDAILSLGLRPSGVSTCPMNGTVRVLYLILSGLSLRLCCERRLTSSSTEWPWSVVAAATDSPRPMTMMSSAMSSQLWYKKKYIKEHNTGYIDLENIASMLKYTFRKHVLCGIPTSWEVGIDLLNFLPSGARTLLCNLPLQMTT